MNLIKWVLPKGTRSQVITTGSKRISDKQENKPALHIGRLIERRERKQRKARRMDLILKFLEFDSGESVSAAFSQTVDSITMIYSYEHRVTESRRKKIEYLLGRFEQAARDRGFDRFGVLDEIIGCCRLTLIQKLRNIIYWFDNTIPDGRQMIAAKDRENALNTPMKLEVPGLSDRATLADLRDTFESQARLLTRLHTLPDAPTHNVLCRAEQEKLVANCIKLACALCRYRQTRKIVSGHVYRRIQEVASWMQAIGWLISLLRGILERRPSTKVMAVEGKIRLKPGTIVRPVNGYSLVVGSVVRRSSNRRSSRPTNNVI